MGLSDMIFNVLDYLFVIFVCCCFFLFLLLMVMDGFSNLGLHFLFEEMNLVTLRVLS